jgi:SAM-dependent methyltransferase
MARGRGFDYKGKEGEDYHARRYLAPEAERWVSKLRASKIQKHVEARERVFEYGVGFGWNLAELKCSEKSGYDLAGAMSGRVERKGIQFISNVEELETRFDVVVCHHTLEHVPKPWKVLELLTRKLKQGGKLLLFVPLEREQKYRSVNPSDKAHHLYSWTPASVTRLVRDAGLNVVSVETPRFRFDRAAAAAAYRLKLGEIGYRSIRKLGQLLLPEYEIALVAHK